MTKVLLTTKGLSNDLPHEGKTEYLAQGGGGLLLLTLNGTPDIAEALVKNFKLISIADK